MKYIESIAIGLVLGIITYNNYQHMKLIQEMENNRKKKIKDIMEKIKD